MNQEKHNPDYQDDQNFEEEQSGSGKGGLIAALIIFIILFAASTGLHVYQQFALGDGSFAWQLGSGEDRQLKAEVDKLQEENEELLLEQEDLRAQINNLQAELDEQHTPETDWMTGTVYEVQIGAFRFFDMAWYEDNFVQMQLEHDQDYTRLTIGRFRDLERARYFRQDIERMGVEEPVIIERVDGERRGIVD